MRFPGSRRPRACVEYAGMLAESADLAERQNKAIRGKRNEISECHSNVISGFVRPSRSCSRQKRGCPQAAYAGMTVVVPRWQNKAIEKNAIKSAIASSWSA